MVDPNDDARILTNSAANQADRGDLEAALETYEKAIQINEGYVPAILGAASCLRQLDRTSQAGVLLSRCHANDPQYAEVLDELGLIQQWRNRHDLAIPIFDQVLEREQMLSAMTHKAFSFRLQGRFEEARSLLADAFDVFGQQPDLLRERGYLEFERGWWFDALMSLIDARDNESVRELFDSLRLQHRFDEAYGILQQLRPTLKKQIWVSMERALTLLQQGKLQEAYSIFDDLLRTNPTKKMLFIRIAAALRENGRLNDAIVIIKNSPPRVRSSSEAVVELAHAHIEQGEYADGIDLLIRRGDAYEAVNLFKVLSDLIDKQRYGLANLTLEYYRNRVGSTIPVLYMLSRLRDAEGNSEEAVAALIELIRKPLHDELRVTDFTSIIATLRRYQHTDEAREAIRIALGRWPANELIVDEEVRLYIDEDDYNEAISKYLALGYRDRIPIMIEQLQKDLDLTKAEILGNESMQRFPQSDPLYLELQRAQAFTYLSARHHARAAKLFGDIVSQRSEDDGAHSGLFRALQFSHQFDKAEKAAKTARRRFPDNDDLTTDYGWLQLQRKRYDHAIAILEDRLRRNPLNFSALSALVQARRWEKGVDAAVGDVELVIHKFGETADTAGVLWDRGWLHLQKGELEAAEKCYSRAVKLAPDWLELQLAYLVPLQRLRRQAIALETLEKLTRKFKEVPYLITEQGWFHYRQHNLTVAKQYFQLALKREASDIDALDGMWTVHFDLEEYKDAETRAEELLKAEPNYAPWHVYRAWSRVRLAELVRGKDRNALLKEAEEACRKAVDDLDPKLSDGYKCLGVIQYKQRRLREAEESFRRSIELDERGGAYVQLGALYVEVGRHEEAAILLQKALEVSPDDSAVYVELGNLHMRTEALRRAIGEYRQATILDPSRESGHRALAVALIHADEINEAERALRSAIESPDVRQKWRLQLVLSQLLTRLGDESSDSKLYEDAYREVEEAIRESNRDPDAFFQAGVVSAKLGEFKRAVSNFKVALQSDIYHSDAERYLRRVHSQAQEQRQATSVMRTATRGGIAVAGLTIASLVALWLLYLVYSKVTETTLAVITPLLLGLMVVAFLMPKLSSLKLPGFEAQLSQPEKITAAGPVGGVGFNVSPPTVSTGPR